VLGDVAAARVSGDLADAAAADIVVVLTSAPAARLAPTHVRRGGIVIDAAEPANISDEHAQAWRGHLTVVRGGRVRIPGYHSTYDFGLENRADTFACLAETYLCAREGIAQHSVGTPDRAFAEYVDRVAVRHGVLPAFALPVAQAFVGAAGAHHGAELV
jgi:predicted amino acid dehydrogenase